MESSVRRYLTASESAEAAKDGRFADQYESAQFQHQHLSYTRAIEAASQRRQEISNQAGMEGCGTPPPLRNFKHNSHSTFFFPRSDRLEHI